jgi:hypothetical protein
MVASRKQLCKQFTWNQDVFSTLPPFLHGGKEAAGQWNLLCGTFQSISTYYCQQMNPENLLI